VGDHDLVGNEGAAVVILLDQRGEDRPGVAADFQKGKALLADDPAAPDEKGADLRPVPLAVQAVDVLVPGGQGGHALPLQGRLDCGDPVAQLRRLLEIQVFRLVVHPLPQAGQQRLLPPFQEGRRLGGDPAVGFPVHALHTGGEAALDLVLQAGPDPALELPVPAGPQGEERLQEAERLLRRRAGGIRAEILRAVPFRAADELKPGKGVRRVDPDVEVGLVVAEIDVVAGAVLLDQRVLEDQGLLLRLRHDEGDVIDTGQEEGDHEARVRPREVGADAGPQILGLSHVEDPAVPVLHQVDARRRGGVPDPAFQRSFHAGHPPSASIMSVSSLIRSRNSAAFSNSRSFAASCISRFSRTMISGISSEDS